MTELINDEAVYRTAPATPGLLNSIVNIAVKYHTVLCCGLVAALDTYGAKLGLVN